MTFSLSIGTCQAHGKMLFSSRKRARLHGRRAHPGDRMSAYECDQIPDLWHYGHLHEAVVRGWLDRASTFTRRIDLPE